MKDLFSPVIGFDEDIPSGISEELRAEIITKREAIVTKMINGIKEHLSYADAVGYVRGLDFVLGFAKRKADAQRKIAITQEEDDLLE